MYQDAGGCVADHASEHCLTWLAQTLRAQREAVLDAWLAAAAEQPFHRGQRERAVADHIPALYDALVMDIQASDALAMPVGARVFPIVQEAAAAHARARAEQGLQPPEIIVEFRLLRQEISRALHAHLPEGIHPPELLAAHLLVNDALDEVMTIGLSAMMERVAEVKEDFLATTVHDVWRPVTVIKVGAQLCDRYLMKPQPELARVRSQLARVMRAAGRMERLLSDLTDASRVALGHLTITPGRMDLAALVRHVVSSFEPSLGKRVRLHAPAGQPVIGEWDGPRLEQVLENLLSNAIKYTPAESPIEITIEQIGDEVHLQVRDQGIGLTPDEMARLFERYARGRRARASGAQGIGLGLYLCRGLVEAHGGRIWAESPGPDQGTTFHLRLPVRAVGTER